MELALEGKFNVQRRWRVSEALPGTGNNWSKDGWRETARAVPGSLCRSG